MCGRLCECPLSRAPTWLSKVPALSHNAKPRHDMEEGAWESLSHNKEG